MKKYKIFLLVSIFCIALSACTQIKTTTNSNHTTETIGENVTEIDLAETDLVKTDSVKTELDTQVTVDTKPELQNNNSDSNNEENIEDIPETESTQQETICDTEDPILINNPEEFVDTTINDDHSEETYIWKIVPDVITIGATPMYECPHCGFKHLYGVEVPVMYHICPQCGVKIEYPEGTEDWSDYGLNERRSLWLK